MRIIDFLIIAALVIIATGCPRKPTSPEPPPTPIPVPTAGSSNGTASSSGWEEADPSNPEVAVILEVHARAKKAFEARSYRDLFEVSLPARRADVLNSKLLTANRVAKRMGEAPALAQLLEPFGVPEILPPDSGESQVQRENRVRELWSAVKDPPGVFAVLTEWLDKRGQPPAVDGRWFVGEPHVCSLKADFARVCMHLQTPPPWPYCEMWKSDGRWFLIIG